MLTFKKIVAATFMVLSVIATIAMIIALFGSWVVKARLEMTVTELLLAGENVTQITREAINRVDGTLGTAIEVVDDVDAKITEIGQGISERAPLLNQLLDSLNSDLVNTVNNAVETFRQIEANIIAINDAMEAISAIPMLGMEARMQNVTKLQEVENQITRLREDVNLLIQLVQAERAELIEGKISNVTNKTSGLRSSLQSTRTNLIEADARLAESGQSMAQLRQRLPALLTTITILLNLFFILSILGFVSLFLNALEYFKCPQDGIRGLLPGECAEAAVAIE
jgi:DNA repair exonuclease SbcCD ATPase subunit